jgi:hypothetical protein
MTPETKKRLAYGAVILIGGGIAIVLWKKHEASLPSNAQAQSSAEAQQQQDAQAQEAQLAELSALGSSGASLSSPSLGETPVENFGAELEAVLQAAGLAPPTSPASGTGATPAAPVTSGTGSTGTTTPTPTPAQPPVAPIENAPPRYPITPIITHGGPILLNPEHNLTL